MLNSILIYNYSVGLPSGLRFGAVRKSSATDPGTCRNGDQPPVGSFKILCLIAMGRPHVCWLGSASHQIALSSSAFRESASVTTIVGTTASTDTADKLGDFLELIAELSDILGVHAGDPFCLIRI